MKQKIIFSLLLIFYSSFASAGEIITFPLAISNETGAYIKTHLSEINATKNDVEAAKEAIKIYKTDQPTPESLAIGIKNGDLKFNEMANSVEKGELGKAQKLADDAQNIYLSAFHNNREFVNDLAYQMALEVHKYKTRKDAPRAYKRSTELLEVIGQRWTAQNIRKMYDVVKRARMVVALAERGSFEDFLYERNKERREVIQALTGGEKRVTQVKDALEYNDKRISRMSEKISKYEAETRELKNDLLKMQEQLKQANKTTIIVKDAMRAKLAREEEARKKATKPQEMFSALVKHLKKGDAEVAKLGDGSIRLRLVGLKFKSGYTKFGRSYKAMIKRVSKALAVYRGRPIRVEGHTDNKGDVKVNQRVSLKRAEAVRNALAKYGVKSIKAIGFGEVYPIASNEFKKGRAMNRRIEVVIAAR